MDTNKKATMVPWYFITSLCLLFAAVVLLIFLFMRGNQERIIEQNQQYLEDAASQSVKRIDEVFDNASKSISMVSKLYELQLSAPEFDYRLLNDMTEPTPFDYIRFVSSDGVSWSGDGTTIDCLDREYYLNGMQGESGVCFIPSSRFTNGPILIFYVPLYYNGTIIGVVNGVRKTENLSPQLKGSFFGKPSDACISTLDGTIVASSWKRETRLDTLQDSMFSDGVITEEAMSTMKQAMENGNSLSFRYTGKSGQGNAYLEPLAGGKFIFVQTIPSSVSHALTDRANLDTLKLEIELIAIFLCYVALFALYYIRRNRKLALEKENLGQIVDSVKRLYRRFVVFNLEEDSYEYLEEGNISLLGVSAQGKYSSWLNAFRSQHADNPKYWDSMDDMTVEHLQQTLTKENWYTHREYPTPDGRWERLSLIKLDMEHDYTTRVLAAVEDITEIKKRDEENQKALESAFHAAEAANRAKSDFLSRMSHDIRTPMNAIIGLTAILGAHLDDRDRIVDCLTKITSSSKHLLGLINEVLDMSKIESGKLVLTEAEFSLSSLMDDLLTIVQPMARSKRQELTVHIQKLTHEDVIGDSLRLQQVCVNILINAVKYTGEGGHIAIYINEFPGRTPQLGEYTFTVEDDGIGMSPEFLERIYTPFERAEDNRISEIQGTGLGMAITQSIVQLMGGTITAESELGKGSRFTVHVPLKLQEEREENDNLAGLPVLVADDDQIACETTCLLLSEMGMNSEWVLNGEDAVNRVRLYHRENMDYFAVILDWKMPGMDGVETARTIRHAVGDVIPIIILSSYDWSDIEVEARAAGVNAFIGKPLFKSRLRSVFSDLISDDPPKAENALEITREKNYNGKRVLLVEDNVLNQEIAQEILEMTGLTVDLAENGKAAVDRFTASPVNYYAMIFMDVQMPIMDGYRASRSIREMNREDAKRVPIVAMTANTFTEDVQTAKESGMSQHLGKPLDVEQLMTVLEKWLD